MNICVIVPVYNLGSNRFENFKLQKVPNIYVLEQKTDKKNVNEFTKLFGNVKYIPISISENTFNKSKLINTFVSTCNYEYIWMLDCDIYLNFSYVLKNIPQKFEFIRPYEYIIKLNDEESKNLLKTDTINIQQTPTTMNNAFGKYSFIICKNLFKQIGGYDINFKGWGYQDLDLVKRLPSKSKFGFTDNIGFHLYHQPASLSNYDQNKTIYFEKHFNKVSKPRKKILKQK